MKYEGRMNDKGIVRLEEGTYYRDYEIDKLLYQISGSGEDDELAYVQGTNKDGSGMVVNMKSRFFVAAIWEKEQEKEGHDN